MSALAAFTRLPVTSVEQLRDDYELVIERDGETAATYDPSGHVLATLLPYLSEQGIELMRSPFDALTRALCQTRDETIFIFTPSHKDAFLARLSPAQFSSDALRDYFNQFNETEEPEIGEAMLEGIAAIRQSLEVLDDDSVILFSIA